MQITIKLPFFKTSIANQIYFSERSSRLPLHILTLCILSLSLSLFNKSFSENIPPSAYNDSITAYSETLFDEISKQSNNPDIESFVRLSSYLIDNKNYDLALPILIRLSEVKKISKTNMASVHNFIGTIFYNMKEYQLATLHYNQSIGYNPSVDFYTYGYIGSSFLYINQLDSALLNFQNQAKLASQHNWLHELILSYNNLGFAYQTFNQFEKAQFNYNKAIDMLLSQEMTASDSILLYNLYGNKGIIFFLQEKFKEGESLLLKEMHFLKKTKANNIVLFSISRRLFDYYTQNNQLSKALTIIDHLSNDKFSGITVSEHQSLQEMKIQLNILLNKPENNKQLINDYFTSIKNVIANNRKVAKSNSLLLSNYQLRNVELQNKLTESKLVIVERSQENLKLLMSLIILLSASLLGVILLYVKYRQKKMLLKQHTIEQEKIQLTNELTHKNSELEKLALKIIDKNEFLIDLKNRLKELPEKSIEAKKIKKSIAENLYLEKDKQEFLIQIENLHQSFLYKLTQRFPTLTKTEKRLASLLVVDLNSKDIAIIMNISPDSVKKARYRLRKKLELDTKEDLVAFLKKPL